MNYMWLVILKRDWRWSCAIQKRAIIFLFVPFLSEFNKKIRGKKNAHARTQARTKGQHDMAAFEKSTAGKYSPGNARRRTRRRKKSRRARQKRKRRCRKKEAQRRPRSSCGTSCYCRKYITAAMMPQISKALTHTTGRMFLAYHLNSSMQHSQVQRVLSYSTSLLRDRREYSG